MKKYGVVFGLLTGLIGAAFFAGCNVGLGESIDIDSPVLEIKYPPIAATIRDKFTLYGTWGDDKGVTSVSVSLVNTDTKEKVGSFLATVNPDKTWELELNEFDGETGTFKYKDGSYQVSVAAYDAAGHSSGESSRTFDIDNTPPVFIISNPGVVKSENLDASAYGSVFTIDGTIADDHPIALMDVAIYDEDGNLLSHETYDSEQIDFFREEEIATAGGTSVTIAQFADNPTTVPNNRYSAVYGSDSKAGTKKYYASVTLTDSAKVYQNPTESERSATVAKEESNGNSTSNVYLYDDVYTTLMSAKKGMGLSAADLKDILNGTKENADALALLNEKVRDTTESEDNRLYFSLNPEANPTYTISGYALDFGDDSTVQQASNGSTVTVTINAGLDGVNINPATMKLWMIQLDSMPESEAASQKVSSLVAKVKAFESTAASDGEKTLSEAQLDEIAGEGWNLVFDNSDYQGSSVSVKSLAVTLPSSGILLHKFYLLAVTGCDADDVEFSQKTAFGFLGTVSGISPTIIIKSPMNGDFVTAGSLKFTGTAMVNNPSLCMSELKATITASDGNSIIGNSSGYSAAIHYDASNEESERWTSESSFRITNVEKDSESGVDVFTWEFNPGAIDGFLSATSSATKYTLDVYGTSSSGHDITASSMVQLDTTPPEVKITTITPTVSGSDFDESDDVYINGTIRILGTIVEQNIDNVTYDIWASDDLTKTLTQEDSVLTRLTAADSYYDGNLEATNKLDVNFPTTAITKLLCGNSDRPIKIRVTLSAVDKVGNRGEYSSAEYNGGSDFIIYQETDRPKVKFGNADETITSADGISLGTNLFGTTNNNKLQVTVSDDDLVESFKIHLLDENGNEISSENVTGGKTTVDKNYSLPSTEGKYKIKVEAFDENYNDANAEAFAKQFASKVSGPFFVAVDSGAPNIEISSPTAGSYQSRVVSVEGFVRKPGVKVSGKLYSVSGGNSTLISSNVTIGSNIPAASSANAAGEYTWNDSVTLPANANGGYKLEYTATDGYGQTATSTRQFVVDITPPKFAITTPASPVRSVFTKEDVYTVKGTVSDGEATSGIKDVYYRIASTPPANATDAFGRTIYDLSSSDWERALVAATSAKGEYTFTANVTVGAYERENGTKFKSVYFAVKDEAGNISVPGENPDSASLQISLDKVPPETTLEGTGLKRPASSLGSNVSGDKDDAGNLILADNAGIYDDITYYSTGSSYSLGGTISEASESATVKVDGDVAAVSGGKWTFSGRNYDGTHVHEIVITDEAGNSSTATVSVIRDTVPPTLTVSNDVNDNDALNVKKIITEENTNHSTEIDTSGNVVHKYLLSGKWSDTTSGTAVLQYSVYPKSNGDGTYSNEWSEWRDVGSVTKSTAETTWSVAVPMTEGFGIGSGIGLKGRAIDAAGNVTENAGHTGLTLDFCPPKIKLTSAVPKYVKNGETLTITGTCEDTYSIESLVCTAKKDGVTVDSGSNGYTFTYTPGAEANALHHIKSGTFEIKVIADENNNGKWTFDLAVTDKANRTTSLETVSTTIDTKKPEWSSVLVNKAEYSYTDENEHSWYKSFALPFAGTLSESGSGIKEIQYYIVQAGSTPPENAETAYTETLATTKSDGTESFSGNLGEFIAKVGNDGKAVPNDVYMKAVDYAGNESDEKIFHIYIDDNSPSLLCDRSGTVYSDLETAISVTGTMDDDVSGVKSVKLTISDAAAGSSFTPIEIDATLGSENSTWSAEITKEDVLQHLTDGHIYSVKAAVKDRADNAYSSAMFSIQIDKTPPYVSSYSISNSSTKYKVYNAGSDKYFVNNSVIGSVRNIFTVSGSAEDSSSGISKVEFTLTNTEDSSKKIERTLNSTSGSFTFDDIDLSGWEGGATGKFVITDGAGNSGGAYNGEGEEIEVKITFDNAAPKGIHAIDANDKDIFLRVGDNDNDEISTLQEIDKNVGGKYSVGTYGKDQTVKLRGNITDGTDGSGVAMIYYKVIAGGKDEKEKTTLDSLANTFLSNYEEDSEKGYFKPNKTEEKRVFYTPLDGGKVYDSDGEAVALSNEDAIFKGFVKDFGTNGSKLYATVTTNYDNVFSGFELGYNYVFMVSVDNVGNAALDSINVVRNVGGTETKTWFYNYSLNVDTTAPEATGDSEESLYTNATGTVTLSGKATDDAAGIRSIAIKVNGKTITTDANCEYGTLTVGEQTENSDGKKERAWTVVMDAEKVFDDDDGNKTVYALVTDNAGKGNGSTSSVGTVVVDTKPPIVSLNAISDAEADDENVPSTLGTQINGNVTLSGTISNANNERLPENAVTALRYNTTSATLANDSNEWRDFASLSGVSLSLTGNFSFTISGFDTTKLSDGTYYIQAVAKDSAENSGYSEAVKVEVKQDTDRPKVNITNLNYDSSLGYLLKYGTRARVSIRISDDDSISNRVVEKLVVSKTPYTGTGEPSDAFSFIKGSYTTGEFTFEPDDPDDGEKRFYIYIKDNAGGEFYTTATAQNHLSNPKILLNEETQAESVNSSVFSYISDSKYPSVVGGGKGIPYSFSKEIAKDESENAFTLESGNSTLNANYLLGGTKRKFVKFHFAGKDASGISGMMLDIAAPEKTEKYATSPTITGAETEGYTVNSESAFAVTTNGETNAEWTTDFIDVSEWGTGQVTATLKVYDRVGLSTTNTFSFAVDNTPPTLKITSPERGKEKTGKVTFAGTSMDTGNAGNYDVRWLIPTVDEVTTANSKLADEENHLTKEQVKYEWLKNLATSGGKSKWNGGQKAINKESSLSSWQFDFDDTFEDEEPDEADFIFVSGNPKLEKYQSNVFASSIVDGVYTFPVYFMAVDYLGNYTIDDTFSVIYNPDGDRPIVEFSYPTVKNYDSEKDYITLGGTIRASGSAAIPLNTTSVGKVFIQIADENGKFTGKANSTNSTDDSYIAKNRYGFDVVDAYSVINSIKGTSYAANNEPPEESLALFGFSSIEEMRNWWGIPANGTGSWNIALNSDGKMNSGDNNSTNNVVIRACAVNAEGKMGAWTRGDNQIAIHIDNNVPTMAASLNQYEDSISSDSAAASASSPTVSQSYSPDMFLRGQWYLVIDVLDESGIKESISVKSENGNEPFYKTEIPATEENGKHGYKLFIPVDKMRTSVVYTVKAEEDTDNSHSTVQSYSFNIDNTPPTMDNLTGNGEPLVGSDTIWDKDYVYSIEGKSTDEGSGVERVVFYYMRKNGVTKSGISSDDEVILDPMIATSGSDYSPAKVKMTDSGIEALSIEQDSVSYELYARKIGGSSTLTTFTANSSFDSHVRTGGLIFIDGLYRRISNINGREVTFEPSASQSHDSVDAWFPIAQVIDNTSTEKTLENKNDWNPFQFEAGKDDGDLMPESFSKSVRTWTWNASVHSTNLPDGPVSLVILAFDAAGNVNGTTVNTMVSNNAPQLAKLYLATDLNCNSKFEDDEFESYSIIGKTGKTQETYNLSFEEFGTEHGAGLFTAKDKLAVVPEIVGGNGNILLVAKKGAANANAVTKANGTSIDAIASAKPTSANATALSSIAGASSAYTVTASKFTAEKSGSFYAYVLENSVLSGIADFDANKETAEGRQTNEAADGSVKSFSFTFWDSTELTEQGTDSQKTVIRISDFTFDLTDGVSPKVVINPFYWKSLTENSIYGSSTATSYSNLKGHIELENDLSDKLKADYGNDPKVSGIVTFTGTAYDDHSLASLSFTLADSSGNAYAKFANKQIATYDSATSSWTPSESTIANGDGYEVHVFDTGSSKGVYGDDTYFGQSGHKIFWTVSLDTSKIDTVVAKDVKLTVLATDTSGNVTSTAAVPPDVSADYIPASSTGTRTVTDGETNVATYEMDVMPYITKVTTSLSSLKKNNPTVYSRTALGHYPVRGDETITFEGFNLNGNTSLSVSTLETSGEYTLKVKAGTAENAEEIPALNNLNSKDAKGAYSYSGEIGVTGDKNVYKNYYNRQPNGDNNNLLTDDIVLDVWEIDPTAVKPKNGTATQPVMAIDPATGKVGFAFVNGNVYFSMPYGNNGDSTNSYEYWLGGLDFWNSIGLVYDTNGYSYGTAAGGDLNASKHGVDTFSFFTSRWGKGEISQGTNGYQSKQGRFGLEFIGEREYYIDETTGKPVGFTNFSKERIKSPSLAAVATSDSSKSYVYLAYYDSINDEIRFKWGVITNSKDTSDDVGMFGNNYSPDSRVSQGYSLKYSSLIAGHTENKLTTTATLKNNADEDKNAAPVSSIVKTTGGQDVYAGEYVCIAAIPGEGSNVTLSGSTIKDDVIVAVWWDGTNHQMLYSYNTKPKAIAKGKYLQADTGWSTPVSLFPSEVGEYCKVCVDANKGVHIAAYDSLNGDLWYAYLSSYSGTAKTGIIDSAGFVGSELNIDVALDSNKKPVPYISYYALSASRPKIAKWIGGDLATVNSVVGADSDCYSDLWEISIVPTSSKTIVDHVNVGVWKELSGTNKGGVKDSVSFPTSGVEKFKSDGNGHTLNSYGNVYGNGTSNPILGYATKSGSLGYIETAQMR